MPGVCSMLPIRPAHGRAWPRHTAVLLGRPLRRSEIAALTLADRGAPDVVGSLPLTVGDLRGLTVDRQRQINDHLEAAGRGPDICMPRPETFAELVIGDQASTACSAARDCASGARRLTVLRAGTRPALISDRGARGAAGWTDDVG
jgi:hypothetical protein